MVGGKRCILVGGEIGKKKGKMFWGNEKVRINDLGFNEWELDFKWEMNYFIYL